VIICAHFLFSRKSSLHRLTFGPGLSSRFRVDGCMVDSRCAGKSCETGPEMLLCIYPTCGSWRLSLVSSDSRK